jgi:hypothetical protein
MTETSPQLPLQSQSRGHAKVCCPLAALLHFPVMEEYQENVTGTKKNHMDQHLIFHMNSTVPPY